MLRNNLLIERDDAEERSTGGLYLAQAAQKKPHRGVVRHAGPGYRTDAGLFVETTVKPGDRVLFAHEAAGVEVVVDGKPYVMMSEDLVIAILGDA